MTSINYNERIPNNVGLGENRRLQRALESWLPNYLNWWDELGPEGTQGYDVYLRTAVDVGTEGWAHFNHVKMPEYRWGIFLNEAIPDRRIGFGDHKGEPVWQEVPGEYRSTLRRLIVTQGDTEPASVEQQRVLGQTAPSLYDLRNLFQINVEEGRHLWAMVYLLHAHFGRDGREEAEMMLERHSGDPDKPRILGAFNEPTPDWLSMFMFAFFTDRDGKFQLASLAESGFDPLARTCQFMLTEEAHHMFVGESGVMRIVKRTCEVMDEIGTDDPERVRQAGAIDLQTMQKWINFHYSISVDLFGQELSTNAANYYTQGLKGRYHEGKIDDDHRLVDYSYPVLMLNGDKIVEENHPALTSVNEKLRQDYIDDCQRGMNRWNKVIEKSGHDFQFKLPHRGFNRAIGNFAEVKVSPDGRVISEAEWTKNATDWMPTESDREFVKALMKPCYEQGKIAGWIAPPTRGVHGNPFDYEYVKFN
ncbi:MAG: benzoyl-CoA 2,3-epoxidase subunit BoxB [Pseudomonadota bacterium]|nr:benzoyl-CoA 2,3-epoxidase subunit BoxB [Pseudomonadota bacterium]MEC8462001.1 benzoyl-CoA 2,3-epoxidase subunit BoxB [Pseudomonadota bacterium]MEC9208755.1 benzoyl-CoA 2,3-epoxidase subunit BoxB [Pseudomonadota bacterium]